MKKKKKEGKEKKKGGRNRIHRSTDKTILERQWFFSEGTSKSQRPFTVSNQTCKILLLCAQSLPILVQPRATASSLLLPPTPLLIEPTRFSIPTILPPLTSSSVFDDDPNQSHTANFSESLEQKRRMMYELSSSSPSFPPFSSTVKKKLY